MDTLKALLLKDKAWVKTALAHLHSTVSGDFAGGRVPDGPEVGANDQRRRLFGFDLGKSVGLELAPSLQMLAELLLCSQGEEVRLSGGCGGECFNVRAQERSGRQCRTGPVSQRRARRGRPSYDSYDRRKGASVWFLVVCV